MSVTEHDRLGKLLIDAILLGLGFLIGYFVIRATLPRQDDPLNDEDETKP